MEKGFSYLGPERQGLPPGPVEEEMGNRVDIGLSCRHYLKTVDSGEMEGPLDFEVEDYLTLHRDHLAQEEGYLRPEKLFTETR